MTNGSPAKVFREVCEIARERGWAEVAVSGGNHLRIRHPDPDVSLVFCSSSPSDHRWKDNLEAQLRRAERQAGVSPPEGG